MPKSRKPIIKYHAVTYDRDDRGDPYRIHSYKTLALVKAFIAGVEYVNDPAISLLGVFRCATKLEALRRAKEQA